MYKVRIEKQATKALEKLELGTRRRIAEAIRTVWPQILDHPEARR